MAEQYLFPCPGCNKQHRIAITQAGSELRCDCGATVELPTMRLLRKLKKCEPEANAQSTWGNQQAVIFLGLLIVIGGLTTTGFLWIFQPTFPYDALQQYAEDVIDKRHKNIDRYTLKKYFNEWRNIKRSAKRMEENIVHYESNDPVLQHKQMLKWNHKKRLAEYNRYMWISSGIAVVGLLICLGGLLFFQPRTPN